MHTGFKITAGILGALLAIILLLPFVISWNQYKELIQNEAYKATGRQLTINGDIRLGLLPSPYARLNDVVIANPEGATSAQFASVDTLDVGVALAPLFSKKVQITHITVTEPAITLEVMANGQNNWTFTPINKKDAEELVTEEDAPKSSQELSIDDLTIEKGFIRYVDVPKKSQQTIGPIDGKFSMASLQGPVTGRGTITVLEKMPIRFDMTVDALPSDTNKNIPFKLSLAILGNVASADIKGVATTGDAVSAQAETAITIPDLEKLLAATSKDNKAPALPSYMKGKTSLTGLLQYADNAARIDNLMIKTEKGMELQGSVTAKTGDATSITVDMNRAVLPPEAKTASTGTSDKAATSLAKTLENSFKTASGFLDAKLPTTPMNLVFTATQFPAPGLPPLRDVRMAISTAQNGVTIQNIETKLPGNTSVKLSGSLPAADNGTIANARINARISTQNIQAAMGNDGQPSTAPVTLETTVLLTRETVRMQPLKITQNNETVNADIVYNPKAEQAITVAVTGSALNLDSFIGEKKAETAKEEQQAKAQGSSDPFAMLQGLKAAVTAELGQVTFQGKTAKNILVNALLGSDGLTLSKARIGDMGGMVIDANGRVAQLNPLKGVDIKASAQTPNLSRTLKTLGNAEAANMGASQFSAVIKGDNSALDVGLNGTIDQGKVALNGRAQNIDKALSFDGKIDVTHPETATIVRNFAQMKPKVNLGAFGLKAAVVYGTNTLKISDLDVKLGSAGSLSGHVYILPEGNTRSINVDLRSAKLALAALMGDDTETNAAKVKTDTVESTVQGWSKEPINLEALRNLNGTARVEIGELLYQKFVINDFMTSASFANNTITLEQLKGALFDAGTFNINGQLAPGATGQAHKGDFTFAVNKTDAAKLFVALGSKPFSKGILDLNQKITFSGASPYAIINSLNGDGQIKVTDGIVNGIDLDGLAAKLDRPNSLTDFSAIINQARAGGETPIGNLDIPVVIRNGVVQVQNTEIKTQLTAMAMRGRVDLPSKQVDMTGQITFVEQRNLPPLTLNITGPMHAPQKSFDTRNFTQFYAQKATEKLQGKVQDKLNKLLGIEEQPAAQPTPQPAPTVTPETTTPTPDAIAPAAPTDPVAPTAPVASEPVAPAAPAKTEKEQREDALKQLGGQMLNNLLGGGR